MAGKVAVFLSDYFDTEVHVGRLQLSLFGHAIADDFMAYDQQQRPMLHVTRIGAELNIRHYFSSNKIVINSAQLYGATGHVIQDHPDSAFNFQFIVDRLSSKKSDNKKDLPYIEVRTIMVRHTNLTSDRTFKSQMEGFDTNHLQLSDLSLTGTLNVLDDDTLSVSVKRISFSEKSGLNVTEGNGQFEYGKNSGYRLQDAHIGLVDTRVDIREANYFDGQGSLKLMANIKPSEFQCFYNPVKQLNSLIDIDTYLYFDKKKLVVDRLNLSDSDGALDVSINGDIVIKELLAKVNKSTNKSKKIVSKSNTDNNPPCKSSLLDKCYSLPDFNLNINKIKLTPEIEKFNALLGGKQISLLNHIGETNCMGQLLHNDKQFNVDLSVHSALGNLVVEGFVHDNKIKSHAEVENLQLDRILSVGSDSLSKFKTITGTIDANGSLSSSNSIPEGQVNASIEEFYFNGYTYHGINASLKRKGTTYDINLKSKDQAAVVNVDASVNTSAQSPSIEGVVDIPYFNLDRTRLIKNHGSAKWIDTRIGIDLKDGTFDNMYGNISIPHIIIGGDSTKTTLSSIQLLSVPNGNERHVRLNSPYLTLKTDGEFSLRDIVPSVVKLGHNLFPSLIKEPQGNPLDTKLDLNLTVINLRPIKELLGIDVRFDDGPLLVNANVDTDKKFFETQLSAPSIKFGKQAINNLNISLSNVDNNLYTSIHASKTIKDTPMNINVDASMIDQQISTNISWNAKTSVRNHGKIACTGTVERNTKDGLVIYANVIPTELFLNDTLWSIHPSQVYYRNNELYVDSFVVSMLNDSRNISIHGTASKSSNDSLYVDLKQIDLSYILSMAKLRPISLGGLVSGHLVGHRLFSNPVATGHVTVPHFLFNEAPMGSLDAYLGWNVVPGSLSLKGHVVDHPNESDIRVNGDIHLIKDPIQFLDLDINCTKANAAFMQRYVSGIMDDFEGRVSGNARIYGTFKEVDLDADVLVNKVGITIPALNTRYYAYNDSVHIRPGIINLNNIRAYDKFGGPHKPGTEHSGVLNGQLTHRHFNDLRFNLNIEGQNILAYDTHSFDDDAFYATCLGTGNVHLKGEPGNVAIDINATPLRGTTLTYNATSPDALTHAGFLSFVDRSELFLEKEQVINKKENSSSTDLRINFNVNLTPEAQLRLLMDAKTGDYITLYGSGQMGASYYNKGNFLLYGTTRIDHGTYKLTLQDVIHKEFQIRQGGTIVFNGAPMQADLNLQALYTVPSVSLNDLSMRGTFSNNNVRVNCLMNIDGKAASPHLTFDFELPNVNEEEARMVRSLISTEEERNLQVVYLLGIGRFYTYDYTSVQDQSSTAVNSLLSTTISGQINQVMNNIIGSNDWNFGANLATGNNGWDDVDVEGVLSGRMLNNRLIFNGNFGYRDNPVAQSNFVGDFDLQWLLTKNGNLVLKAYSETNDRYFTKSSLTTQGVGIMAKKDFSSFRDFFTLNNLRKRKIAKPK